MENFLTTNNRGPILKYIYKLLIKDFLKLKVLDILVKQRNSFRNRYGLLNTLIGGVDVMICHQKIKHILKK